MSVARIVPATMTAAACLVVVPVATAGAGLGPPPPAFIAMTADVVVVGTVVAIEPDAVEAAPHNYQAPARKGAADRPAIPKVPYKIAVLKIEDAVMGAKGLTQLRVGFEEGAGAGKARPGPPRPGIQFVKGQEGCFFLTRHSTADFYIHQPGYLVAPLLKTSPVYETEFTRIRFVAKTIDDPVTALKSKTVEDRFFAAQTILTRNARGVPLTPGGVGTATEDTPAEQTKMILALMLELPWAAKGYGPQPPTTTAPCRSALWIYLRAEDYGFKPPTIKPRPGQSPLENDKIWDEATAKFLKDNTDKIKLKRVVASK